MARKDSEHFMNLQRAGEDYLKAVLILQRKKRLLVHEQLFHAESGPEC